jgi:hypothetical protein
MLFESRLAAVPQGQASHGFRQFAGRLGLLRMRFAKGALGLIPAQPHRSLFYMATPARFAALCSSS